MTFKHSTSSSVRAITAMVLFAVCLTVRVDTLAQSGNSDSVDEQPPVIELEELSEGVADSSQVFTVQVAENDELADVILYYRRIGQQAYNSAEMTPLVSSSFYTATIETDPDDLRPIEYYLQARDVAGNRTVEGFAFDPFIRSLAPAAVAVAPVQPAAPTPVEPATQAPRTPIGVPAPARKSLFQRRWFQITVGVIAAGLIASSLDSEDEETQQVPITVTLE